MVGLELQMKNFKKAGKVLSDILCLTEINGYKVLQGICQLGWSKVFRKVIWQLHWPKSGPDWLNWHVRISKYCLKIAKGNHNTYCKPLRINMQKILKGQFLPTPLVMGSDVTLADSPLKSDKKQITWFFKHTLCNTSVQRPTAPALASHTIYIVHQFQLMTLIMCALSLNAEKSTTPKIDIPFTWKQLVIMSASTRKNGFW